MITVVKSGGGRAIDVRAVAADVAKMVAAGQEIVLVHGGAADIERLGTGLGATTRTLTTPDGTVRRYTDDRAIEVVTLALDGAVKPRWLTALSGHGIRAIGLTGLDGGCVRARRTPARRAVVDGREVVVRDDHSGRIASVDAELLRGLLGAGYVPVLSPPAMAEDGRPVNVNADRAAAAVAAALSASSLVLLTDTPGVLGDPRDAASVLDACELPRTGALPPWAEGGMAIKLLAAREALEGGVPTVVIGDGRADEPIRRSLGGSGTRVTLALPEGPAATASGDPDRRVVGLLRDMLEIPSPSGEEERLARFLVSRMAGLGLSANRDMVGNVVATTGTGNGPVVLLVGHMDTTPGPNAVREDADRLTGRGAADAKGPLAAMIAAAAARPDFPGTIIVAGAVEEETPGSRGACHLAATLERPDAVIVGEPGRWSNVVIGYKGKLDLVYRVERPATHPTNPAQKATEAAMDFWRAAVEAGGPRLDHAAFDVPGLTLHEMTGDITGATMRLSYRTPVGFDDGELLRRLREAAGDARIEVENSVRAVRSSRANPVVRALLGAIRAEGGRPRTVLKTATSDMNTLAEVWDCPMATYGPGDNRLGHADDEYIEIGDLLRGVRVLGAALDDFGAAWKE